MTFQLTGSMAQQNTSPQVVAIPLRIITATPMATATAIRMPTQTATTLPPAIVIEYTATPTPEKSKPTGLYLQNKYIPVEDVMTSPEILDGTAYQRWQVPLDAAGHHSNSPAFGEQGNVIIVGHSIWYGKAKVFAPVISLEVGDILTGVNADGSLHHYYVTSKRDVPYDDGSWLITQSEKRLLTLYTCNLHLTGLVVVQAEATD